MPDIFERINELTEKFSNLFEDLSKEEKEKHDKIYRTMLSKFRKDAYAEDKDPKYSLDNEHGQKVFDYVKKRLEDLKHDPSSARKKERMLFRTESLNVQEQLIQLIESFSNLFEVDDLGQPAMDVPPSQNKIKRDRKTKDGKVELVSVEDELFPYDGNKREQYRQKILDTINNMIQGTATLEDLLQIVRQKKAPLKEAMELMEDLFNTFNREHEKESRKIWDKADKIKDDNERTAFLDKAHAQRKYKYELRDKILNLGAQAAKQAGKDAEKRGATIPKSIKDFDTWEDRYKSKNEIGEKKTRLRHAKYQKKTPLKEAMELMEDILGTIDKKYPEEDNYEKHGELYSKALDNQWKEQDAARDREYSVDDWYAKGQTKNQKGELKTYLRKVKQLQDRLEKQEDSSKKDNTLATEKAIKRHNHKKTSLKEAMELVEDIRSAIEKKHGKPEYYSGRSPWQVGREPANKSAKLTQKANEIKEKEALQAAERELDKDRPDLKDAHPAKKNYKVADYYGQIMARRNGKAPLKEAMELMENIYSQIKKVHGEDHYNPMNKSAELVTKASNIFNKEISDSSKREGRDTREKRIDARVHNGEWTTNHGGSWSKHANDYEGTHDPEATEKSIARHFDKVLYKPLKSQANITRKAVATEKFKRMNSEALEEALNVLLEGRKEGESKEDFKHRLHGELVRAIDKKAAEARDKAIEASKNYYETGKGRAEAIKASEKAKKEHDKLGKLDDIEPVANAYMTVESLKEAIELMETLLSEANHHANKKNPVVKITADNLNVASGKSLPSPWREHHIGQYIVYNKDTDASYLVTPDNWKKSKIKRDLEKQGKVYEAIRLMEELLNEKVTVAKWVEAAKKVKDARADKASKELAKNIFGKEDNGDEAHNAVHRQAHAEAVSKLAPSDDNAQDVREIHRAAIEPLRKKVDRAIKAGKSTTEAVKRLEKAQEIAGVRPDSSKYVN